MSHRKKAVRTLGSNEHVPPGVRDAIAALAIERKRPLVDIARDFRVDHKTVERIARTVRALDPERINEIKRGLPNLLAVLAGSHAARALETIDDPQASVRHTFGAKLAVEANRVSQPGAEAPGHTMLAFINQLNVRPAPAPPEVIDAEPIWNPDPNQPDRAGPDVGPVRSDAGATDGAAGLRALFSLGPGSDGLQPGGDEYRDPAEFAPTTIEGNSLDGEDGGPADDLRG